jgi:protein O-mannosyl-transferase
MNRTHKKIYSLAASVAFVTFLVYLPALRNEFVYWDDNLYIFENPFIRSLDGTFFRRAFLGFPASNWHPLTWISHALDYAVWGLNPLGHHLTSTILHAVNTALVVVLVLKIFETARDRTPQNAAASFLNDRTILIAAGVTGLLFGIHPVHVESVAWVAERKDLLCALFFLLSILSYVKYARGQGSGFRGQGSGAGNQEPGVRSQKRADSGNAKAGPKKSFINKHYLLSLGLFVLALMSKPMAVSLPLVLLILDWYPFGRVRSWKTLWPAGVEKLPFFVLSLASSVMTILAQRAGEAIVSVEQITLPERALVAVKALVAYLGKMLLPINLIPFYPYPKVVPLFSFEYLSALALFIGITAACVILARKQKFWLSAWGYYVATLIPVLGIVQVGAQSMADRYTYLPSIGLFLLAGLGVAWIAKRTFVIRQHASLKIVFGMVLSCVLVFLCYATFKQISIWQDSISLWSYVIEKEPDSVSLAYSQRGIVLGKKGQTERAIADLEMAIALNPYNYDAYMNLGVAFEKLGQIDKARENVEKAISAKPSSHEAYLYRGVLYEETGQLDKAIVDYTRAIALDSSDFEAYNNRGIAFGKTGQLDKAIADYSVTIELNPRHIDAHSNRGVAYTLTGQNDRALEDFNTAILLDPNDPMTYFNRGSFYRRIGKNDLAFADFQKACDLGNERACGILHQLTQGVHPR